MRAARVLDGRGGTLQNAVVEISGGRIIRGRSTHGAGDLDLGAATLLPGMIDTHVHIGWHFGKDGRANNQGETPAEMALFAAENAWVTLINGFTTVQSAGAMSDRDLRDAINRGVLPGPRVLSSLGSANERTGDAAALRAYVVKQKAEGADFIKIFASKSIRDGGAPTMTLDQLQAACGEAKAQGLRSMVHAQSAEAAILAAKAGCTQVEHGAFVNDEALKLMAERGVYFDPNIGLVLQNYIENKSRFLGIGNYTEEGFAFMEKAVPTNYPMFKKALAAKVKMPMGTDAVAGAHGQNAREIITRVKEGGQLPMDAIIGATSLAAESMAPADADRRDRTRPAGRPRGGRGRPAPGHHRGSTRAVRHEGWRRLPERSRAAGALRSMRIRSCAGRGPNGGDAVCPRPARYAGMAGLRR